MRYLVLLLLPLAAAAQSRIEGRVTNTVTGAPVAKAWVALTRGEIEDRERNYFVYSDAGGKFAIENVAAGQYRLQASRAGFITIDYGAKGPERKGTTLDLMQPQDLKDVEVRLVPHGVLTGRVVDGDGDPVDGAQVQLLRQQYVNGKKTLSTVRSAFTNDLGEYRAAGVAAGKYWLYTEWPRGPVAGATEDYVPAYYVSATDAAAAVPIDVAAGAQVRAGDILLRKGRTTTVKGRVVVRLAGASGRPTVTAGRVAGHNNRAASSFRVLPGTVSAAGEFELRAVTPGSYAIHAAVVKGGRWYVSPPVTIEVGGSKIEGVVLEIDEGLTVTGRIRVEDDAKLEPSATRVRLQRVGGMSERGRVQEDRTFLVRDLDRAWYAVSMEDLPAGYYVKSVRAGEVDITYSGLDLLASAPAVVDILVSPKAGTVSGTATDDGKPVAGATVVLVPKDKERAFYPQTMADQYGRFRIASVVPGEYTVYAWEDVEATAWMDPEFLKDVRGEAVTVGEGASASVGVKVAK
jgi:5-hydroxyisourate hydrolase-like protein (transthyretin family)